MSKLLSVLFVLIALFGVGNAPVLASQGADVAICDTVDNNAVAAYDGINIDNLDAQTRHCVFVGKGESVVVETKKNVVHVPTVETEVPTVSTPDVPVVVDEPETPVVVIIDDGGEELPPVVVTTEPTQPAPTPEPKEKRNCGVGQRVIDGDTPGCENGRNDGEGTGPGHPGSQGGNGNNTAHSSVAGVALVAIYMSLRKGYSKRIYLGGNPDEFFAKFMDDNFQFFVDRRDAGCAEATFSRDTVI